MKMMNAVLFYGPKDIRYEKIPLPKIGSSQILVKIKAALTCGTDVKTYHRGHPIIIKQVPCGFGHEFSGVVEKVANDYNGDLKEGDRIVVANSAPCGECFFCKNGQLNLCENLQFLNGAYAQYIVIPRRIVEKNCYKISDKLSFEKAAFAEPLANVVHGIERTPIKSGQTVGIMGLGPIGLLFAKMAKLKGAKVIGMGRNPLKLKMAKEFANCDYIIDLKKYPEPKDKILSLTTEKKGLDIAIECVGLPEVWEKMFTLVRKGGIVHLFGGCKSGSKCCLDTKLLHYNEIKIISVFHHTPKYFKKAIDLIESGQIDVEKLISIKLPLEKTKQALDMQANSEVIKACIIP